MEIILAVALLVLGVVSAVRVMSTGVYTDSSVDGHVVGLRLAQQKMEDVKNATSFSAIDGYASAKAYLSAPFSNYQREVLVTDNYNSQTGVTKVTVNVYWLFKGKEMSVSLTTLFTDTSAHYSG